MVNQERILINIIMANQQDLALPVPGVNQSTDAVFLVM
jgi:hypothetical protein